MYTLCYFYTLRTKFYIFFSIFFFKIGGAVVFGIGLWILIDNSYVNELLGTNLYIGAVYVLLVTSAIVCIISFFGCFAASKEIKCMLLTVFILKHIQNIYDIY